MDSQMNDFITICAVVSYLDRNKPKNQTFTSHLTNKIIPQLELFVQSRLQQKTNNNHNNQTLTTCMICKRKFESMYIYIYICV